MDTIPNSGEANFLALQREATLAGSNTGAINTVAGKVSFTWQPVFGQPVQYVNIWRQPEDDAPGTTSYRGTLKMELGCNVMLLMLLESCYELKSTQTNTPSSGYTTYTFVPRRLEVPKSLTVWLEYKPSGPWFAIRGMIVEAITVSCRTPETARIDISFIAASLQSYGSSQAEGSAVTITHVPLSKVNGAAWITPPALAEAAMDALTEFVFGSQNAMDMTAFGSDGVATKAASRGPMNHSGEFVEYFKSETVTTAVRLQSKVGFRFKIQETSPSLKLLQYATPSAIIRAGTPNGVQRGDTMNRANWESLGSDNLTGQPTIVLVV